MKTRRRQTPRFRNRVVAVSSVSLLALGLLVDLNTRSELVVAIVFDIPIALSALSTSRRLPLWITGVALAASALAGFGNALENGIDGISILNRALAGLSYLLLGILTIALRRTATRETKHRLQAQRSEQEVQLREMVSRLSDPMPPQQFLQLAAAELRELLLADAVVVSSYDGERFVGPRAASPTNSSFAALGQSVPWPVTTIGETSSTVVAARLVSDLLLVGRWQPRESGNLIVLVRRPHRDECRELLAAALRFLHPLYERCGLLQVASTQSASR